MALRRKYNTSIIVDNPVDLLSNFWSTIIQEQDEPDISTLYLYRRHNQTTLQKNLHLNQKGVMNQLLASI